MRTTLFLAFLTLLPTVAMAGPQAAALTGPASVQPTMCGATPTVGKTCGTTAKTCVTVAKTCGTVAKMCATAERT